MDVSSGAVNTYRFRIPDLFSGIRVVHIVFMFLVSCCNVCYGVRFVLAFHVFMFYDMFLCVFIYTC